MHKGVLPSVANESIMVWDDPFYGLRIGSCVGGGNWEYEMCTSNANEWFKKLGCSYHTAKSCLFFDGHDREDVIDYRERSIFLNTFDCSTTARNGLLLLLRRPRVVVSVDRLDELQTGEGGVLWRNINEHHKECLKRPSRSPKREGNKQKS
ncbi:unnamed protein product [Discosporangium mesarthrocarpum]